MARNITALTIEEILHGYVKPKKGETLAKRALKEAKALGWEPAPIFAKDDWEPASIWHVMPDHDPENGVRSIIPVEAYGFLIASVVACNTRPAAGRAPKHDWHLAEELMRDARERLGRGAKTAAIYEDVAPRYQDRTGKELVNSETFRKHLKAVDARL